MKILSFDDTEELALQTEVLMRELAEQKQDPIRGFFPTGKSAEKFYARLRQDPYWQAKFIGLQIDEFAQANHLFLSQLQNQIILPLHLEEQFETIDPMWSESEMDEHIRNVVSRPIDFALLGLGPNGHIGFHEPGRGDSSFMGGRITLTPQSADRVMGATTRTALSFGAGSFLKAEKIFLLATGEGKEQIFKKFIASEATKEIPATLLKQHPNFYVLTNLIY